MSTAETCNDTVTSIIPESSRPDQAVVDSMAGPSQISGGPGSACHKVLKTTELAETIILAMSCAQIMDFMCVDKHFVNVVACSTKIQKKLWLMPQKMDKVLWIIDRTHRTLRQVPWEPDAHLKNKAVWSEFSDATTRRIILCPVVANPTVVSPGTPTFDPDCNRLVSPVNGRWCGALYDIILRMAQYNSRGTGTARVVPCVAFPDNPYPHEQYTWSRVRYGFLFPQKFAPVGCRATVILFEHPDFDLECGQSNVRWADALGYYRELPDTPDQENQYSRENVQTEPLIIVGPGVIEHADYRQHDYNQVRSSRGDVESEQHQSDDQHGTITLPTAEVESKQHAEDSPGHSAESTGDPIAFTNNFGASTEDGQTVVTPIPTGWENFNWNNGEEDDDNDPEDDSDGSDSISSSDTYASDDRDADGELFEDNYFPNGNNWVGDGKAWREKDGVLPTNVAVLGVPFIPFDVYYQVCYRLRSGLPLRCEEGYTG